MSVRRIRTRAGRFMPIKKRLQIALTHARHVPDANDLQPTLGVPSPERCPRYSEHRPDFLEL
jgi:hypothetical protein